MNEAITSTAATIKKIRDERWDWSKKFHAQSWRQSKSSWLC